MVSAPATASQFEFATAQRVRFGAGTRHEVPAVLAGIGGRVLAVTGRSPGRVEPLLAAVRGLGVAVDLFEVSGEPTVARVQAGCGLAREREVQAVLAVGGGSVLDAGKAIAGLTTNPGDPLDYLEVIGRGRALTHPPLPWVAVPTTAGTGTEVTRNAVLASTEHRVKVSLRSPFLLPSLAVVDPELTFSLPAPVTAATGLDALTQLIEPFVSCRANPLVDGLCREGMTRAARSLRTAWVAATQLSGNEAPGEVASEVREARTDLALASLFSGLALANAGLGAVHGFAGPVGGRFAAPHGAVCAALLAPVMAANLAALSTRAPRHPARDRYDEIGRILTGSTSAGAEAGLQWVRALCRELGIPPLRTYGMRESDVPEVVDQARKASSMKANPIELTPAELEAVLEAAL